MKNLLRLIILLILIGIFVNCHKTINKKMIEYNGIDDQILNIIDSLETQPENPFVTIWFSSCNDSSHVIRFFNSVLIPALPPPSDTIKELLISESNDFLGYKKYHDIYLVFLEHGKDKQSDKFIKIDSLKFDEEPFVHFRVYDLYKKTKEFKIIKRQYLINKKDSLIFFEGKCSFDID